jgi:hypothetical protein
MCHNVMNTIHRSLTGKGLIGSLLFFIIMTAFFIRGGKAKKSDQGQH